MSERYSDRTYAVVDVRLVSYATFEAMVAVSHQSSVRTCRYSNDGSYALLKWSGSPPPVFVDNVAVLLMGSRDQVRRAMATTYASAFTAEERDREQQTVKFLDGDRAIDRGIQ